MPSSILKCGKRQLDLSTTHVMGVLNVTPDSFSDGGAFFHRDAALKQAHLMVESGATIIDIGGESTRPGAEKVSLQEELDRVCPILEKVVAELDVVVSIDTSTPEVMRESVSLGCGILNDVRAFSREGALDVLARSDVGACVMHMQGQPDTMQDAPSYEDPVQEVIEFLAARARLLVDHGVDSQRIVLDPGFGFGKTLQHNLALLRSLSQIHRIGYPVLAGISRKSMIGAILNKEVDDRLYGSLAAAVIASQNGARIIRAHDVAETVDVVKVVDALVQSETGQ